MISVRVVWRVGLTLGCERDMSGCSPFKVYVEMGKLKVVYCTFFLLSAEAVVRWVLGLEMEHGRSLFTRVQ